jgi:hypothetical protein
MTGEVGDRPDSTFAPDHALRRRHASPRPVIEIRLELAPCLGGSGDFGQRPGRKARLPFTHGRSGPLARSLEGEPVADVLLDAPELFPSADRLSASKLQLHEVIPVVARTETVHHPDQVVDVGGLDSLDSTPGHHGLGPVLTGRSRRDHSEKDPT